MLSRPECPLPPDERCPGGGDGFGRFPLVLDLSGVDFLTAGGVGELVRLHARLREMGGELVLDNVGERAFEVLETVRLTDVLTVRRGEALGVPKA